MIKRLFVVLGFCAYVYILTVLNTSTYFYNKSTDAYLNGDRQKGKLYQAKAEKTLHWLPKFITH